MKKTSTFCSRFRLVYGLIILLNLVKILPCSAQGIFTRQQISSGPDIAGFTTAGQSVATCYEANGQTNSVNGLCLLCSFTNPRQAADGDTNSYAGIHVPVGLLGGYATQTYSFSSIGKAGDSIRIIGGYSGSLLNISSLSSIQISTMDAGVPNNDAAFFNSSLVHIRVLASSQQFMLTFPVTKDYDHAVLTFNSGLVSALSDMKVYDVQQLIPATVFSATAYHTCSGIPIALQVTAAPGVTYNWYATASGGASVFSGPSFLAPATTSSLFWYVSATRSGCEYAQRTQVRIIVDSLPALPISLTPVVLVCAGSTATLTAHSSSSGASISWFTSSTGGVSIAAGDTLHTGIINAASVFYAQARNAAGCVSLRTPVTVSPVAAPAPPVPLAATVHICAGSSAVLGVLSQNPATSYSWYTAQTGGTAVFTGLSFTTPVLNHDTAYYVSAAAGLCPSARVLVAVTVTQPPSVPLVSSLPPGPVSAGQTVQLSASGGTASVKYSWYADAAGLNLISTGAVFHTPALAVSTSFYVKSTDTLSGCMSALVAVPVSVNAVFNTGCDFASSVLNSVAGICPACSVLNPGYSVDTDTTNYTSLNVSLGLAGAYAQQTLEFPVLSQAGDSVRILLGIPGGLINIGLLGSIQISSLNGLVSNADLLTLNSPLIHIQVLGGSGKFLVSFLPGGLFDGVSIKYFPGLLSVAGTLNIYYATKDVPLPVPVIATTQTYCSGQAVTLSVGSQANSTFQWFAQASGGISLAAGISFTTPILTASSTYYVQASRTSTSCLNPVRVPVQVIIVPVPGIPVIPVTGLQICAGQPVSISATASAATSIAWYDAAVGGNLLFTGNVFTTAALSASTTFYAQSANGSCTSASRLPITIAVSPVTPVPVPIQTQVTICAGQQVQLGVQPVIGIAFNWYAGIAGGVSIFQGSLFTTAALSGSETLYVEAVDSASSCKAPSARTAVTITVIPLPGIPVMTTDSLSICTGASATFIASAGGTGTVFKWYQTLTDTAVIFTGASFTTPPLTASASFYVSAVNGNGCTSSTRKKVTVITGQSVPPPQLQTADTSVCAGSTATITASVQGQNEVVNWYDQPAGGNLVFSGFTYITGALSATTSFYAEASNGTCTSQVRSGITIKVRPALDDSVSGNGQPACSGQPVTLTAGSGVAGTTFNWYGSQTGTSILFTGAVYTTPPVTASITYYVQAVNSGYCPGIRIPALVSVQDQLPAPRLTVSATSSSSVTFSWITISGAAGYALSLDTGLSYLSLGPAITSYIVQGLQPGQSVTAEIKATGAVSCANSVNSARVTGKAQLEVATDNTLYVPNAFTPNSDGKNDVLQIYGTAAAIQFSVFNQWGQLIFHSTDQSVGWDGTFRGIRQPEGVYVYMLSALNSKGKKLFRKGSVTLIR